jgi:hypothetical protein
MTVITGNRQLAARARELAGAAAPGTLARKAAGAVCIALATTKSLTAARGVLTGWDGPADVRSAAAQLLEDLAAQDVPAPGGAAQKERNMQQGSAVWRTGSDRVERGRVLATFELTEDNLTEWELHRALTPGPYAAVKWDHGIGVAVEPLAELQEVIEG